jgi:hypothetical protein
MSSFSGGSTFFETCISLPNRFIPLLHFRVSGTSENRPHPCGTKTGIPQPSRTPAQGFRDFRKPLAPLWHESVNPGTFPHPCTRLSGVPGACPHPCGMKAENKGLPMAFLFRDNLNGIPTNY